ncbi:glycine cleavage system protein GcvH [Natribacillus halophilus]|uniref:Glycine cleavage system H protein n=1 Tax=Natribacillus halophilus TaxID=549003 RepID=A0A1G8MZG9_9BACI|nr:glycine cleavage system protein GcvH [Natribacillus halophilus]SDI73276.1 glycine cleavage system H protein [Natribacillus halophilus]
MSKWFSEEHEWVEMLNDDIVRIGITDYAQQELGDIVFVESPEVDDSITSNESMGTIESVKTVSDIYAPLSGIVVRVNEKLEDEPELVNTNSEDEGWLIEMKITDREELNDLLDEETYKKHIEDEGD